MTRPTTLTTSIVTGGCGFLGSHLVDDLVAKGHNVIVIDDLSGGFLRNIDHHKPYHLGSEQQLEDANTTVLFEKMNLADEDYYDDLERLFECFRPEYIFHLAAYATEGLSHFIRLFNYKNNLLASVNLINLAVKYKVKRFVFTSSMATYGEQPVPYTEDMKPQPEDPYGTAKYAVEQDLHHAYKLFGLPYTIFRPHNIVGPRQHIGDTFRNVVGIFINQAMQGKPLTIFGDGSQVRAFSYVKDIIPYISACIENDKTIGQIYNAGGEKPYTINELAQKVIQYYGSGTTKNEPPRYEVHTAYSNHDKLYRDFGHLTEVKDLDYILPEMIEWAKTLGPQEPTVFGSVEIKEKIPPKRHPYIENLDE